VKYGQEGKSDFWRLPFSPDLCRYVRMRAFLERPPIRAWSLTFWTRRKCKEFACTVSAIRELRTTTGGANLVIGFRPELRRDLSIGFGAHSRFMVGRSKK